MRFERASSPPVMTEDKETRRIAMEWCERILDARALMIADTSSLPALVDGLLAQQRETWPQLAQALTALEEVETRTLTINHAAVRLQHNPQRIVSTSARVDERSIRERPCFLCAKNMPAEEKGLPIGESLIALCNPFPVLDRHLVIVSRDHIPQQLEGHTPEFLELARSLGNRFVTLYNGPKCGASAPDHLHFQAGTNDSLSVFAESSFQLANRAVALKTSDSYGAGFLWFREPEREAAVARVERILEVLQSNEESDDEAMINLLARHDGHSWEVVIIPRRKHRPTAYFRDELLVSPAAIDLAGLVVVPRERDFQMLDAALLRAIFEEVTYSAHELDEIARRAVHGEVSS